MGSKYNYDGIPLDVYCKSHGLNLETQRNRVRNYVKEHPELTVDAATKLALDRCGTRFCKYKYNGISLAEYCENNGKNYSSMVDRIEKIKEQDSTISDEEATRIAIKDVKTRKSSGSSDIKYYYSGMPLVEYCRLHPEYNYNAITLYIRRHKEKNPKSKIQDIINSYFKANRTHHTYHYVNGVPLLEYCDKNGIVYGTILDTLSKMRHDDKFKHLKEDERLQIALANYKRRVNLILYRGVSLYKFCKENDYSYNSI